VAVLAILSAIAIPQFSQLSDDARLNSVKSIMANMYKECEFNKARTSAGFHTLQVNETPGGVFWGGDSLVAALDGTGCDAYASAKIGSISGSATAGCIIAMDMTNGASFFENATTIPADGNAAWGTGFPANASDCV
jgi:Tfp pilus assembly protein FimT